MKFLMLVLCCLPFWGFSQKTVPTTTTPLVVSKTAAPATSALTTQLFLNVDYDVDNHLLTILSKDGLKKATITVFNEQKELIYQESNLTIDNLYLLSINEDSPQGRYYVYVEEENRGIWVEQFQKRY